MHAWHLASLRAWLIDAAFVQLPSKPIGSCVVCVLARQHCWHPVRDPRPIVVGVFAHRLWPPFLAAWHSSSQHARWWSVCCTGAMLASLGCASSLAVWPLFPLLLVVLPLHRGSQNPSALRAGICSATAALSHMALADAHLLCLLHLSGLHLFLLVHNMTLIAVRWRRYGCTKLPAFDGARCQPSFRLALSA